MNSAVEEPAVSEPVHIPEERPVHLARCGDPECAIAVKFKPSASGASFILVDADPEASFGVGENGRPVCPNGHGEMTIADDALKPAAEAFAEAQQQLDAAAPRLPFPVPAFNYEGVLHALLTKRHEIAGFEKKVEDRKEALKRAKDELDDANTQLGRMLDQFERDEQDRKHEQERRARQAEGGHPDGTTLVRCEWERQHAGEKCPLCGGDANAFVVKAILGDPEKLAAQDAVAHLEDVERFLTGLEVDETREALGIIDAYIDAAAIAEWTPEDRKAVTLWADYQFDLANANEIAPETTANPPTRPTILGKPHIPAPQIGDGLQRCSICDEVLRREPDTDPYQVTDLVDTDCSGKAPEATHHYPVTSKKKPAAKAAAKKKTSKK